MGCDIHAYTERKVNNRYERVGTIFDLRSYSVFGWLANVRNYSKVTPLSEPRGLPDDLSDDLKQMFEDDDLHSKSYLTTDELLTVDYEQVIEDRRCMIQEGPNAWNGGGTCEPGQGEKMTLRKFLGDSVVKEIEGLRAAGIDRVVFGFDN